MRRAALAALVLCLALTGCSVKEAEQAPEPEEPVQVEEPEAPIETEAPEEPEPEMGEIIVTTDWSKLGERESLYENIGSRWYEEYTDHLILRDDYGTLIPYAGERLMDDWPASSGCLYGLMTLDGVVVTDPVYSFAYYPAYYAGGWDYQRHELLVLWEKDPEAADDEWNPVIYAVAAGDGSWCTPFEYTQVSSDRKGLVLFKPDSLTVMTPDGDIQCTWTVDEMGISQEKFDRMCSEIFMGEGVAGARRGDYFVIDWAPEGNPNIWGFNLVSGEHQIFTLDEWKEIDNIEYEIPEERKEIAIPDAERISDVVFGYTAPGILELREYSDGFTTRTYYLDDGTPLPQFTFYGDKWYEQISVVGGLIEVLELNTASYYDIETLECVFRTDLNYELD